MATKFNKCPNCGRKPKSGLHFDIKQCQDCDETFYCKDCGGNRCPDCGTKKSKWAGRARG